ncbi:hypothetical protein HY933_01690 [Candidatus Falkowbacteria bacterium]|nr:hypothetical protein [Candidatus Falkowbacteria bacterium]
MFKIFKIYRWKEQAKFKLADPNRKISDEYFRVLKNQSKGNCVSCGVGKIKSYVIDKDKNITKTIIKFSCGHAHTEVLVEEILKLRESVKALLVPEGKGKRNFVIQHIQGWFKSNNPNLKDGVLKDQIIDRRNDKYKEKVVNASNKKEIIKDQEHSLSEHQGYGSAKFKK